jgi:hypothetical protein
MEPQTAMLKWEYQQNGLLAWESKKRKKKKVKGRRRNRRLYLIPARHRKEKEREKTWGECVMHKRDYTSKSNQARHSHPHLPKNEWVWCGVVLLMTQTVQLFLYLIQEDEND